MADGTIALEKDLMRTIYRLGKKEGGPLRTQPLPVNTLTLVSHLLQLTCITRHISFMCLFFELSTLELL